MARLDYLDPDTDVADRIRARRGGALRPLDQVLLHSPELAGGWNGLLGAVREHSSLPGDVREVVILRVAVLNRADYEWDAHAPIARRHGVDDAGLAHLRGEADGGASPLSDAQQVACDFATELTRYCRVSPGLFGAARELFGAQGVLDLTVTVGAYNMVSRVLTALDVDERLAADEQPHGAGAGSGRVGA